MFSKRTKPPVWQVIYGDFIIFFYVFRIFPLKPPCLMTHRRVPTKIILPHEVLPAPCSPCPGPVRVKRAGRTNLLRNEGCASAGKQNGHWNSEFSHEKMWFSIATLVYQRVYSGWWLSPTPLKNDGVKVSWDLDIPNIWKVIKAMFQTTNQI